VPIRKRIKKEEKVIQDTVLSKKTGNKTVQTIKEDMKIKQMQKSKIRTWIKRRNLEAEA
jgi:hypothetical protein